MRGSEDELDVVTFKTLGAPRASAFRARRPKRADPAVTGPESLPFSRVAVIPALGFEDDAAAEQWLDRCRTKEEEREQAIESALEVANRAIHAHRLAAADPYVVEVTRAHAHSARLGYGSGEQLVEGQWRVAYTVPSPRRPRRRRQMLAPTEQLAAILSGRSHAHPSEDLVLRARLDLDQGRPGQAALQLGAALTALRSELERGETARPATAGLEELEARVRDIAGAALHDGLDRPQADALEAALVDTERTVRRRRHRGEHRRPEGSRG